jgi:cystathionine beta-lyase
MASWKERLRKTPSDETRLVHLGRDPQAQHGFVNPPIQRGSTVLFPTVEELLAYDSEYTYGRRGTPTTKALCEAMTELEGGRESWLAPSGLAAVTMVMSAFLEAGDEVLITDNVYGPARRVAGRLFRKYGVTARFFDPAIGGGIAALFTDKTRLVMAESPGSQTFEMSDLPAIASACKERNIWLSFDNTWATALYFKPLAHGADVVIQAATKYVTGHADTMMGVVTASERAVPFVRRAYEDLGMCSAPEDAFLGLRGLRSMAVRLARHGASALEIAEWLGARPEVERVLHPALPSCPGHEIWKRDYKGSTGLFSIVLKPCTEKALAAMLDGMALFGMGYSWGGYESLMVPFDPRPQRTATRWPYAGPALRLHIGLDDPEDLKADLEAGFERLAAAS